MEPVRDFCLSGREPAKEPCLPESVIRGVEEAEAEVETLRQFRPRRELGKVRETAIDSSIAASPVQERPKANRPDTAAVA